jgi:hypothetical protein
LSPDAITLKADVCAAVAAPTETQAPASTAVTAISLARVRCMMKELS